MSGRSSTGAVCLRKNVVPTISCHRSMAGSCLRLSNRHCGAYSQSRRQCQLYLHFRDAIPLFFSTYGGLRLSWLTSAWVCGRWKAVGRYDLESAKGATDGTVHARMVERTHPRDDADPTRLIWWYSGASRGGRWLAAGGGLGTSSRVESRGVRQKFDDCCLTQYLHRDHSFSEISHISSLHVHLVSLTDACCRSQ